MYKCLGCDKSIPWDGSSMFSYTCPCGATVFYNEETDAMSMPMSVVIGLRQGRASPHLADLVGESNHTSPIKEQLIKELQASGFIWMEECEQCKRDGTLKRRQGREAHLATLEAEAIIRGQEQ